MKSQNKKSKPAKQVNQDKMPDEQSRLRHAEPATPVTQVTQVTPAKGSTLFTTPAEAARIKAAKSSPEKTRFERLIFTAAITGSLVLHATVLLVHFVMPKSVENKVRESDLEVILVNAKHEKRPAKADALAQADLDGGGAHDSGRSKSPLPDMKKSEDGDALQTNTRRITELEEQQKQMLDLAKKQEKFRVAEQEKKLNDDKPKPSSGNDQVDTSKAIARMAAEINQTIEDQNKRPKKISITPTTQKREDAVYYKEVQKRIEDTGTLNFPQKDGKKLYGELFVSIPISPDGRLYEGNGGPRIESSSGDPALDAAALRIVRRSAPFKPYPKNAITGDGNVFFEMMTKFKFTHEEHLETELRNEAK